MSVYDSEETLTFWQSWSCIAFCRESNMLFACYLLSVVYDILRTYSLRADGIRLLGKLKRRVISCLGTNHIIIASLSMC